MGSMLVPFERAFVTSYRPSIVTFPLSLRVSEILQSVDKDQQEVRAVADKPRDAVVKYDTYRTYSGIARSSLQ